MTTDRLLEPGNFSTDPLDGLFGLISSARATARAIRAATLNRDIEARR